MLQAQAKVSADLQVKLEEIERLLQPLCMPTSAGIPEASPL
jgi:hypothetical protein